MEWRLTPGVGYLYGNLHLGASLLYVRRKETVNYQNMGSHTTYPVLVAYPLGFFKTLSWGENVNWYYSGQEVGGALQLHFNSGSFQLYQDISGGAASQTVESDRIKNKKKKAKQIAGRWSTKVNCKKYALTTGMNGNGWLHLIMLITLTRYNIRWNTIPGNRTVGYFVLPDAQAGML